MRRRRLRTGDGQSYTKYRVSRLRAEVEIAVVEVGEATRDVEAESRSRADRLRGEERFVDAIAVLLRNARAVIRYSHDDEIAPPRRGFSQGVALRGRSPAYLASYGAKPFKAILCA